MEELIQKYHYEVRSYRGPKISVSKFIDNLFTKSKYKKIIDDVKNGTISSDRLINDRRYGSNEVGYIFLFVFYPELIHPYMFSYWYMKVFNLAVKKKLFYLSEAESKFNLKFIRGNLAFAKLKNFSIIDLNVGDKINDLNFVTEAINNRMYFLSFSKSIHRDIILEGMKRDRVYYPMFDGEIIDMDYYFSDFALDVKMGLEKRISRVVILAAYNKIGLAAIKYIIENTESLNLLNKKLTSLDGVWDMMTEYRAPFTPYNKGITIDKAEEFITSCPHLLHIYKKTDVYFVLEFVVQKIKHTGMYINGYEIDPGFNIKIKNSDFNETHVSILKDLSKLEYHQVDRFIKETVCQFISCGYKISLQVHDDILDLIFNSPTLMKIIYKDSSKNILLKYDLADKTISDFEVAKYYIKYCKKYRYIDIKLFEQAKTALNESGV